MKITPLGNRVLIELLEDVGDSKIILPENSEARDALAKLVVIDVGPGQLLPDGTYIPIPLKAGDEIVLNNAAGNGLALYPAWKYDGRKFSVVDYDMAFCKIERDPGEIEKMRKKAAALPKIVQAAAAPPTN